MDTKENSTKQEDELSLNSEDNSAPNAQYWLLYVSHFLQTFGDRLWQFAVPILFTLMFKDTIFPQAVFAFGTFLSIIIVMPLFGAWIDSAPRLTVITVSIVVQNVAIVFACVLLYLMADLIDPKTGSVTLNYEVILIFVGLMITSMIAYVMGKGATLALEKDWVYVFASHDIRELTIVNARMKRIDLFCKIVAPGMFGIIVEFVGEDAEWKIIYGSTVILVWNVIGLFLEYASIRLLYNQNEELLGNRANKGKKTKKQNMCVQIYNGWNLWLRSNMILASIAYCSLYVNVLSGGPMVTAYLRFAGLSFLVLGIAKGIGALFGIFGTFITPHLYGMNWSMPAIGLLMIWLFLACLMVAGSSFIYQSITGSFIMFPSSWNISYAYLIVFSMVTARTPLWSFDIAENQLMQTRVPTDIRGYINGVQMSMCNVFYLSLTVMAMVFHSVDQFYILVFYDLIIVFFGAILYSVWYSFPQKFAQDHYRHIFMPVSGNKNTQIEIVKSEENEVHTSLITECKTPNNKSKHNNAKYLN